MPDTPGPDADAGRGDLATTPGRARRSPSPAGEAWHGADPPARAIPPALRLKENLLLVGTALVMCVVYNVRQEGTTPWTDGLGAFLWCWLGWYGVLLLMLLLVHLLAAVTDKYLFGERGSRTLRATGHQPTLYACLAILAVSLLWVVLR